MSGETTINVIGNLTADPELRFTEAGTAVVSFSPLDPGLVRTWICGSRT